MPAGSAAIISGGVIDFLAVKDIDSGINVWGSLYTTYSADTTYNHTPLLAALSIAYYTSQYWSYVVNNWTFNAGNDQVSCCNSYTRTPTIAPFMLPKWLKTVLIDLAGALGGAEAGATVGSIIPGVGSSIGAAVGAVIGGAGASAAA